MEKNDIKTIVGDARQLLEKILDFTGQVSGEATIWWSPKMRPAFPWRSDEPLRAGTFPYKFQDTEEYLISLGVLIKIKKIEIPNPFYLYPPNDIPATEVKIDAEKTSRFLQKSSQEGQEKKAHSRKGKPKYEVKDGVGLIILGAKESKPFKNLQSREWKLVKQLVEFFGIEKTDESIYDVIKLHVDSKRYSELSHPYNRPARISLIINNMIGEIQRNFAGSGLVNTFTIHHIERKVWMDFSK